MLLKKDDTFGSVVFYWFFWYGMQYENISN